MKVLKCWVAMSLLLPLGSAHADAGTFVVGNQNPLIHLFGLGRDFGAALTGAGVNRTELSYSVASNFEIDARGTEQIVLDGELERLDLRAFRGLSEGWEVGVEVPLVRHSGGYLDDLIVEWHDAFGLPQNGRDEAPEDVLRYRYAGANGSLDLSRDASGIGDVQLFVGRTLVAGSDRATALRAHVKLPTGDQDKLLGSGGVDFGVTIHHEAWVSERVGYGVWLGATLLGDSDVLDFNRRLVGQGGVRGFAKVHERVTLKVQWDVHSQVYEDTRLRQLNEIAYLLSFGGTIRLAPSHALDLVVVENYPHPQISPDVAFQLSWRWRP